LCTAETGEIAAENENTRFDFHECKLLIDGQNRPLNHPPATPIHPHTCRSISRRVCQRYCQVDKPGTSRFIMRRHKTRRAGIGIQPPFPGSLSPAPFFTGYLSSLGDQQGCACYVKPEFTKKSSYRYGERI
jgi:hypothetical protein